MLSPRQQSRRAARLSVIRASVVPDNTTRLREDNDHTTASPVTDVIQRQSISSDEEVYDRLERLNVFDSTDGSPYTRRKQEVQAQQHNQQRIASDDIEIVENFYSESDDSSDSIELVGNSSVEDFAVISKNEIARPRL